MLGITLGDPNGISPELIAAAYRAGRLGNAVVYGPARALPPMPGVQVVDTSPWFVATQPGVATPEGGQAAFEALTAAADALAAGTLSGLCTLPINKLTIQRPGFHFPGHTEFLGERFGAGAVPLMLFIHNNFRLATLTAHIPLNAVAARVTRAAVLASIQRLTAALRRDFGIAQPRIAILGLNPHAGDGGLLGTEELSDIIPAIEDARAATIDAHGPFPSDGFFTHGAHLDYDATLAMYHDQGLIPFKALTGGAGVNFTAGLPIVRTSPDHGTAYDIVGQHRAHPDSFFNSLDLAWQVIEARGRR